MPIGIARRKLAVLSAVGLLAGLTLGGPQASAADHMKMTFNWVADTGYIPFLYADQLGYYKDAGIEMEFEQGRGSMVTSQLIAQGKADVGYADSGAAISVASKGGPIKIIAVINQANSYGLVSLADSGIKTPQDLVGKKIAVCPGCAQVPLLDAFMAVQHLDPAKVEIQNVQESAFAGLLTEKKIDAVAQDPQTIMVPLAEKGVATQMMYFRDNGVALVSFGLIANEEKLKANPDLYRRFVAASLKGLAASMKNPEAGVDALRKYYPDSAPKATALASFTKYDIPTFCIAGAKSLGSPPQSAWDMSYEIMTKSMNIPTDKPMNFYYTTDYLPADAPSC
jgi:NitT/TauT family transport system substrate-binding protein